MSGNESDDVGQAVEREKSMTQCACLSASQQMKDQQKQGEKISEDQREEIKLKEEKQHDQKKDMKDQLKQGEKISEDQK